jgi:hypothetical protein
MHPLIYQYQRFQICFRLSEETATFMLLIVMISFEVENHITMEDVMAVEQLVFRLHRNVCSGLGKKVCFCLSIVWLQGWLEFYSHPLQDIFQSLSSNLVFSNVLHIHVKHTLSRK